MRASALPVARASAWHSERTSETAWHVRAALTGLAGDGWRQGLRSFSGGAADAAHAAQDGGWTCQGDPGWVYSAAALPPIYLCLCVYLCTRMASGH